MIPRMIETIKFGLIEHSGRIQLFKNFTMQIYICSSIKWSKKIFAYDNRIDENTFHTAVEITSIVVGLSNINRNRKCKMPSILWFVCCYRRKAVESVFYWRCLNSAKLKIKQIISNSFILLILECELLIV